MTAACVTRADLSTISQQPTAQGRFKNCLKNSLRLNDRTRYGSHQQVIAS